MSTRLMLCIALGIQSAFTLTHAANDLEKWNSEVGRNVRQAQSDKLAQTTYREMSSKNVTVSQDMRTVYPQIETQAQVAGSRTRVVAEAVLEVDKDKVWRDWNNKLSKFGRGTAAGLAAGAIVQGIVDGVGWVMDPKNNTIQYPDIGYDDGKEYIFPGIEGYFPTVTTAMKAAESKFDWNCKSSVPHYKVICYRKKDNSLVFSDTLAGRSKTKPSPPSNTPVPDGEKERVLKDLLNDPKYANLAADMIRNTYSIGPENPEPDPNVVNDLKDKQKDVLKSDNPKGDGKTRTDPKIDTGTQGQADTTPKPDPNPNPNPDPGTTPTPNPNPNTGSTTTFELPPFCDYAAIVCDWIDWTKEKPEEEEPEEEEEINDKGIFDRKFDINFDFKKNCPPDYVFTFETKYIAGSYNFTFNWLCIFFNGIGYPLVFLSHCLGAWIFYEVAVRRGNQGG